MKNKTDVEIEKELKEFDKIFTEITRSADKSVWKGLKYVTIHACIKAFLKQALYRIVEVERERINEIDFNIDVRYEEDVIKAFDKFIKKWCGSHYPHLIDTDENDGEFMREKIESLSHSVNKGEKEV